MFEPSLVCQWLRRAMLTFAPALLFSGVASSADVAAMSICGPSSVSPLGTVNICPFLISNNGFSSSTPCRQDVYLVPSCSGTKPPGAYLVLQNYTTVGIASNPQPGWSCSSFTWDPQNPSTYAALVPCGSYYWAFEVIVNGDSVASNNWFCGGCPVSVPQPSGAPCSNPQPDLCLDPPITNLVFNFVVGGQNPADQTVGVKNCGLGTFSWTLAENPSVGWLSEQPISGNLVTGQTQSVTISCSPASLAAGQYQTSLVFSNTQDLSDFQVVQVTLNVSEAQKPAVCTQPGALSFSIDAHTATSASLTIENCGDATLVPKVTEVPSASWLTVGSTSGIALTSGQQATIQIAASSVGLASGTYATKLRVSDANDASVLPVDVPVTLGVNPAITLDGIHLSANTITAQGGGSYAATGAVALAPIGGPVLLTTPLSVTVDTSAKSLWFNGAIQTTGPLVAETVVQGPVQTKVTGGLLDLIVAKVAGFPLAGIPWTLQSMMMSGNPPKVVLSGSLDLPEPLSSAAVDLDVCVTPAGVSLDGGCLALEQPFALPKSPWKVSNLLLCLEQGGSVISVDGTIALGTFAFECHFEIVAGAIDAIDVTLDFGDQPVFFGPPAPQFCDPLGAFALTHIGAKIQNLAGAKPLYLEGTAGFGVLHEACLPPPFEITVVEANPITLGYDVSGEFSFDGALSMFEPSKDTPIGFEFGPLTLAWEGYPCAKIVAHLSKSKGFVLDEAWLDFLNLVVGQIDYFTVDPGLHWKGNADCKLQLPSFLPWPFGGLQLAGAKAQFDEKYMWACASVFSADVCVKAAHSGGVEFYTNWDSLDDDAPKSAASGSDDSSQTWLLNNIDAPPGTTLLIGAKWQEGTPAFMLLTPDGTYTGSSLPADGSVRFYQDPVKHLAVFTVRDVAVGAFTLSTIGSVSAEPSWFGWRRNAPPTLSFTDDVGAGVTFVTAGDTLPTFFVGEDIEGDPAMVTFHLSDVYGATRGRQIGEPIPLAASGAALEIPEDQQPGRYRLYALVADGRNAPLAVFSKRILDVTALAGPGTPEIVGTTPMGTTLRIDLEADPSPSVEPPEAFVVHWTDGSVIDGHPRRLAVTDTFATIEDAPAGAMLRVWATAVDADGRESAPSEEVLTQMPKDAQGKSAPRFVQVPSSIAKLGADWSTTILGEDPDGNAGLALDVLDDPGLDVTAVPGALGAWTVKLSPTITASGIHPVRLRLRDPEGHKLERKWLLHVQGPEAGNVAPEIVSMPPVTIDGGAYSEFKVETVDVDALVSAFGTKTDVELIAAPSFVHEQGDTLTFTPSATDVGQHQIVVAVRDDEGAESTTSFVVFVAPNSMSEVFHLGDIIEGELEDPSDTDDARFLGLKGSKVSIWLADESLPPIVRVIDEADGALVAKGKPGLGTKPLKLKLPRSGWYRLEVVTGDLKMGAYALRTSVKLPKSAGTVKKKLVAKKDGTVAVDVAGLPGASLGGLVKPAGKVSGVPFFHLVAPDGAQLGGSATSANEKKQIILPGLPLWAAGEYTVVVSGLVPKKDAVRVDLTISQPNYPPGTVTID